MKSYELPYQGSQVEALLKKVEDKDIYQDATSESHGLMSTTDKAKLDSLATVATSGNYNDLTNKPTIPTVPTNVSAFTNDAGYLTEHQDISGKVDKEAGKGLSSNDYTSTEKNKLASLPTSTTLDEALAAKAATEDLEGGVVVPKLAKNLESWEGESTDIDYQQTEAVETTGGGYSIESSAGATLESVVPTTDFAASQLVSTGFNLLRRAVAVGNGWYFEVPKLVATAQSIGTALENNGVLFTSSSHQNLTPTVYFKPLASGVPTSTTDGTAATYTDKDGRRHYTTSGAGYLIVSGIDRASVCAHIGWSRRYDEYISVADTNDAGAVVDMAAGIAALHSYGKMLVIGAVADRIDKYSDTQIKWTRRIDRVQPTWTNTAVEEDGEATGEYLHEAVINAMKTDGTAEFESESISLTVSGNTVSYTDSNAEATTDNVKYELAAEATGTATVSSTFACEDWGLIVLRGATGTAVVTIAYAQNVPDNLRTSLPIVNDLRHCTGSISQGYATCTTGTYEAAKTVAIQHFLLLQNGVIHVLFTTPINTEHTTLNVSQTGAKPLRIMGNDLPTGVVKAQTYATLAYFDDAWNIVDIFRPGAGYLPSGLVVDMGLASGLKWAACNIDLTKPSGFADTPFTYECSFFSWGNIDGHKPVGNMFEGQFNETYYKNTKGYTLFSSAMNIPEDEEFDAARANLGEPWRMPTTDEFTELIVGSIFIDADGNEVTTDNKRVTVNGVVGVYLQSKTNGNRLFLPACGLGNYANLFSDIRVGGYYFTRNYVNKVYVNRWYFNRTYMTSGGAYPFFGLSIRAVQG